MRRWIGVLGGCLLLLVETSAAPSVPVEERVILWTLNSTGQIVTACDAPPIDPTWTLAGMSDLNGDGIQDLLWNSKTLSHQNRFVTWIMGDGCNVALSMTTSTYPDLEWTAVGLHGNTVVVRYLQP